MSFQPVGQNERYPYLDVLRGLALFGVLLVNLLTLFRVSLFQHILQFHTDPGRANHLVDLLVAAFVEFKAFTLFSFLFGVGAAIQAERRGEGATRFLLRRFLVLLAFGICHMFLIWNGDILILYAVCGLLVAPALRLPARALALLGLAAMVLPYFFFFDIGFGGEQALRAQIPAAMRVYGHGTYLQILAFRWDETWRLILPLVWGVFPRTIGLICFGAAAWRSGLLREPGRWHWTLWTTLIVGLLIGGTASLAHAMARSAGRPSPLPDQLGDFIATIPLAFAYAAGLLLFLPRKRAAAITAPSAAAGQMALTNYLTQSIVLGFIFYGYGFSLFGRLDSVAGLAMALALYAAQLAFSMAWLKRYRFGPFEWAWRSLTYGRLQSFRQTSDTLH